MTSEAYATTTIRNMCRKQGTNALRAASMEDIKGENMPKQTGKICSHLGMLST